MHRGRCEHVQLTTRLPPARDCHPQGERQQLASFKSSTLSTHASFYASRNQQETGYKYIYPCFSGIYPLIMRSIHVFQSAVIAGSRRIDTTRLATIFNVLTGLDWIASI